MTKLKKIRKYFLLGMLISLAFVLTCFLLVEFTFSNKLYNSIDKMPEKHTGLVLGTSKFLKGGRINPYFKNRIDATALLYKKGKIKYILVSGDNRISNYNEPERMRRELLKKGIPKEKIILDYAGFRTLDSVVRSQKVFGQDSITIISQKFHNKRALYIANYYNIEAIAFNAKDVPLASGLKTNIREVLARVKMVIDLYLLHKEPYFLGDPVSIPK